MRTHCRRFTRRTLLVVSLALGASGLFSSRADAQLQAGNQLPQPRLLTIMPHGAKVGTSVELTFTGQDIEEPEALLFSHPNIKATAIIPPSPPPAKPDPKKPVKQGKRARPNTSAVQFQVSVGGDVPLGNYDVRLVGKWGVSNPRTFVVGDLTEVIEKEPNNDVTRPSASIGAPSTARWPPPPTWITTSSPARRASASSSTAAPAHHRQPVAPGSRGLRRQKERMLARQQAATLRRTTPLADCTLPDDGDY